MRLKKPVGIAVMMLLAVPSAGAGEWSEWGGSPDKSMVAKETGLPVGFPAGEERADSRGIDLATAKHCKWVVKLGSESYGTPTIANGRVIVGTNNESPRPRTASTGSTTSIPLPMLRA
jgi:hypothetical protein